MTLGHERRVWYIDAVEQPVAVAGRLRDPPLNANLERTTSISCDRVDLLAGRDSA